MNEPLLVYQNQTKIDFANTVFVVFAIGQSNEIGLGVTARLLLCPETKYGPEQSEPSGVYCFYKPDETATDNGTFEALVEGSATERPPGGTTGLSGPLGMMARRLKRASPNNVYIIRYAKSGTPLAPDTSHPSWHPSLSGELFSIAVNNYYIPAIAKVIAANPGKTISVFVDWHQGETDALNGGTSVSNYATYEAALFTAVRAAHSTLNSAPILTTKLYFNISANEATINGHKQANADANPSYIKIIDISDMPRNQDLTAAQKFGITNPATDDQHTSHLGHQAKADRAFELLRTLFNF